MSTIDQKTMRTIARNLRKLRGKRSLYWLAKEAGTYPINVSRIEAGKHMPSAGLLLRLASALNTTADRLLGLEKNSA